MGQFFCGDGLMGLESCCAFLEMCLDEAPSVVDQQQQGT
jgi:hypothetical protein